MGRRPCCLRPGRSVPAVVVLLLAVPGAAGAQSFAGTWTEVERSMTVTIDSWGADCPEAPQSSSSRPNTQLQVTVEGDQIVFPRGRRTDRCWSDNPALRRTRFSKQGNRYVVECETPAEDPRQEHGRYVVTADPTRIVVEMDSSYDWTLREAHCKARLVERRVLTREAPAATDAGAAADVGLEDGGAARDAAAFPRIDAGLLPLPPPPLPEPRRCEHPGAPARLRVRAMQTVQPGGRAPVSVHQVDAQGCDLGPVNATYDIIGAARGCRIGSDGVFQACDAVAQCDGESVRIRVSAGALSGVADIRISARIEEGLGTVEPVWIDEPVGTEPGSPGGGAQVSASLQAEARPGVPGTPGAAGPAAGGAVPAGGAAARTGAGEEESSIALWLVVAGGGVIVLAVVIYLIASAGRGRRRKPTDTLDDLAAVRASGSPPSVPPPSLTPISMPAAPSASVPGPSAAAVPSAAPAAAPVRSTAWHCPACRRESSAAGFCVDDGIALVAGPAPTGARTVIWLACPKCGRGYSQETKFCPMERELLLPYGLAMTNFRATLKGRPEPPERVCPRCGARAPGAARFCEKDGEMLVPSR
jgi:hypothetical protein